MKYRVVHRSAAEGDVDQIVVADGFRWADGHVLFDRIELKGYIESVVPILALNALNVLLVELVE